MMAPPKKKKKNLGFMKKAVTGEAGDSMMAKSPDKSNKFAAALMKGMK